MENSVVLGTKLDLSLVEKLFQDVCKSQETEKYSVKWVYGIYPSESDFVKHIVDKELYLLLENDILVGSFVITREDNTYNEDLNESMQTYDLHLFTIHPKYRGQGLAIRYLQIIFDLVKELGGTKLQLDVIKGNLPAENLYLKAGFAYLCEKEVFYENTGKVNMKFFERLLE